MAFLDASLEKVVADLVKSKHSFPLLRNSGLADTPEKFDLLMAKGVFPYSHLTSLSLFESLKEVPPIECFYSNLSEEGITEAEYERAKLVFSRFSCRSMKCYLELYNQTDCYLLAEAITSFRKEVYSEFCLDLCQFISIPQLTMSAFLKFSGTSIELLDDYDDFQDVEQSIRGGLIL